MQPQEIVDSAVMAIQRGETLQAYATAFDLNDKWIGLPGIHGLVQLAATVVDRFLNQAKGSITGADEITALKDAPRIMARFSSKLRTDSKNAAGFASLLFKVADAIMEQSGIKPVLPAKPEQKAPEPQQIKINGMPEHITETAVTRNHDGDILTTRQAERDKP